MGGEAAERRALVFCVLASLLLGGAAFALLAFVPAP